MRRMRLMLPTVLCCAIALPAASEEDGAGTSLMERGAQLFLEGILKEMEPALEGLEGLGPQLRGFAEQMGPAMRDLLSKVDDWSAYHPPEILPNGDIIIRRKPKPEQEAPAEDQIDI